ncbi:predicted protein [Histoplasma mississippiense (nom. inval.)]|uniref:predicted protein n=1 Tax=Ajellomyces capsulatus (strain NAm1 / WU24) TaxID=2059318 RepID=UPI000157B65C|nr:predicted protein [Histoplasma mississippiense (nom. inval.)]EDN02456.1 predicted protein [Histoplasma mississippiense (nom. inval.)]
MTAAAVTVKSVRLKMKMEIFNSCKNSAFAAVSPASSVLSMIVTEMMPKQYRVKVINLQILMDFICTEKVSKAHLKKKAKMPVLETSSMKKKFNESEVVEE